MLIEAAWSYRFPARISREQLLRQESLPKRRWAKRGTRPSAPQDQRTASTYIFGAICPREGKAVGLILPWCNTEAMDLHLAAISADVAPGRHAALLVDQAGWHLSARLAVPDNVTIVPLPAKCPSSTRSRTSGSSCVTTGCQTACSHPTTPSSITAALRGTSSPTSPGASCRSAYEIVQEVPLSESWYQPRVSRFL